MLILGFAILVLGLLAAAYAIVFKAKYHAERTAAIALPPAEVCAAALDLERMPEWSPWLMHDPACRIECGGPGPGAAGGWHSWDSPKIGKGRLTNAELDAPRRAVQRIEYIKPFKGQAKMTWTFDGDGRGGTKVTWRIDGGMPFALRWMNRRMARWLRSDFGCGLLRLRHMLDPSQPTMKFSFDGPCERPALRCVGRRFKGHVEDLQKDMERRFAELGELRREGGAAVTRIDGFNDATDAIAVAYGVEPRDGVQAKDGAAPFEVAGGRYHKVTCTGSHEHLGLARYEALGNLMLNRRRRDRARRGYELYVAGPGEAESPDGCVTEIYLPIK